MSGLDLDIQAIEHLDVDPDAAVPCMVNKSVHGERGTGGARWLIHQRCQVCDGSRREPACDGCRGYYVWAMEHDASAYHRGHGPFPLRVGIVSICPLGAGS